EKLVLDKLEEQGIKRVNKRGTVATIKYDNPVLQEYFPGWKFYRLTRINPRRPIAGGISQGVVSGDNTVYILKDLMTSGKLEQPLMSMLQKGDIRLKDTEDVREFARLMDVLYHTGSNANRKNIVSLGDNQWAIYTGTFFDYYKGFQVEVDAEGKIKELKYDLKLQEKKGSKGPGPAKKEKTNAQSSASVQSSNQEYSTPKSQTQTVQPKQGVSESGAGQKKGTGTGQSGPSASSSQSQGSSRAANIMFILDASGSMWGEVEGRDKIAIAKEVMAGLIRDLPDNTRAGLVAYGHRRKGDCKDVEELVQMSPLDKESLIRIIQGLSPKGKTPITYSVRLTAEKLKVLEDETTIILVSDGKESCGGDPCALVRELKESGLRFVMHVIGFDVTEEGRKQLECMAEAGGGRYFTAKTAGEFETAAREVVQETKTVGFLEIMAFRNETPVKASVEVFKQDTGQRVKKVNTSMDEKNPEVIRLKPGTYKVVFTDEQLPGNPSRSFSDVKVELDQTVSRTARFEAGILELSAIKENRKIHAHARIYQKDNLAASGWLEEGKSRAFSLLPGVYRVEVTDKSIPEEPVVSLKDVEIKSGQSISRQANFSREGELKIEAMREGKGIHVHARVYKGDERVASGWLEEGRGASFKLLPGVYRVEVQDKKIPQQPVVVLEDIEIEPGQTVSKQAQFAREGQLRIEAFKGDKSIHVYAQVYKGDKRVASSWLEEGKGASFKLLPGVYRVEIQDKKIPQQPVVVLEDIEVQPGQTVSKQAQFVQEGQLRIEAFQGGRSLHVYVKVYKGNDRAAYGWLDEGKGKTFKLLPGTYRVEIKGPDDQVKEQKGIDIKSGQTKSVAIEF
ncbi:MAG: VWA domain-containing protein, partial [Desulfobacteraceae bacterium]|nr:VWA domain-containing protein [Desulfobacteraceae bacterium]